ncbi:hypothetical protein ARAM_004078 [Aspergillus rambellii]|uniref:Crh-like protein n=1 Tax=Aspergillus rambellii TaxID=308745 RepID=A0A0F8UP95_9EURO|nr:hypothetical protein ARAM_004078 [Aspergillus rambellii]
MYLKYAAALASVLPLAAAQTWTSCNPLEKTCPADKGLNSASFSSDFTQGDSAFSGWQKVNGDVSFGPNGAEFTVAKKGDSPTIETDFYFFFGKAEVVLQAAPGTGIVSSIVLESDVLDEVDWEALGGDTTQIQTNYFGKGDTTTYDRGSYESVASPQTTFHTYTVDWSTSAITWSIDGAVVRTLTYDEAKSGTRFPQTPMRLRLGIWAGGDSDNAPGTIEWAGGKTDYSAGPFTMYVKSVHIENTNPASSYTYSGNSGSWQSIEVDDSALPSTTTTTTTTTTQTSTTTTLATTTTTTTTTTTSTTTSTSTKTTDSTSTETGASIMTTTKTASTGSSSASSSGPGRATTSASPSESSAVISGSDSTSTFALVSSSSSSSPTPTAFTGAASPLSSSSMGIAALVGLIAAMLQL